MMYLVLICSFMSQDINKLTNYLKLNLLLSIYYTIKIDFNPSNILKCKPLDMLYQLKHYSQITKG